MDDKELKQALSKIAAAEEKNQSLRWSFWRGVFYGFGLFVGSAVLVSLLVYILSLVKIDGDNFFTRILKDLIDIVRQSKK